MIVKVKFVKDTPLNQYNVQTRVVMAGDIAWCIGSTLVLRDDKLSAAAELLLLEGDKPVLMVAQFDEIEYVPIEGKLYTDDLRAEILEQMAFAADMVIASAEMKMGRLSHLARQMDEATKVNLERKAADE